MPAPLTKAIYRCTSVLARPTIIDELRIDWADGTVQYLYDVAANQYLTIATTECDFDGSGICDVLDLNAMLGEGPVANGVDVTPGVNDQYRSQRRRCDRSR